jgi:hypothetical protein
MNTFDERKTARASTSRRGLALTLTILALLPALADCTDANSTPRASTQRPTLDADAVAAAPRPGCRQEFPVQYRGISCAGHDYDPPAIPFGELYPPR